MLCSIKGRSIIFSVFAFQNLTKKVTDKSILVVIAWHTKNCTKEQYKLVKEQTKSIRIMKQDTSIPEI